LCELFGRQHHNVVGVLVTENDSAAFIKRDVLLAPIVIAVQHDCCVLLTHGSFSYLFAVVGGYYCEENARGKKQSRDDY
jgi:uncharacterized protein (UPF0548 family)